jgi:hypothetical protein
MCSSERLKGLELLRLVGAPVPKWQVVVKPGDVEGLRLDATDYGWTIRTCRMDCRQERGLFYGIRQTNYRVDRSGGWRYCRAAAQAAGVSPASR